MYIDPNTGAGRASVTFKPVTQDQLDWLTAEFTGTAKYRATRSAIIGLAVDVLYRMVTSARARGSLAIPTTEETARG